MAKKRVSPIPDVPRNADGASRRWMESVKEALDVRLGRRGDPAEAAVTFNDLIDSGVIQSLGRLSAFGVPEVELPPGAEDPGFHPSPGVPGNFVALGVFGGVHLLWDTPSWRYNVTITEIMRNTVDDLTTADLLSSTAGSSYFDIILDSGEVTYYYWVRHISGTGITGPWSGTADGVKPPNVDYILGELAGKISEFELDNDINFQIDLITAPDTTPGSVNARIDTLRQATEDADHALAQDITQVQTNMGDTIVAVEQDFTAEITRVDGEIDTVKGLYSVSVNANGVAGGFYVAADGTTVQARWDVDRFVIGRADGSTGAYPFVYDSQHGIVMDTAMIRDASIQEGKLGPITIGKIKKNDGTPITTVAGLIRADALDVNNLHVAEAATFTGTAQSSNFTPGTRGWRIRQNGYVEFNQGVFNGTVHFRNVSGAGSLASKNSLSYSSLTGSKPPTNADRTASNTAYDTARVSGSAASSIKTWALNGSAARGRVNSWTRSGTTMINGGSIYTDDAFIYHAMIHDAQVNTLKLAGNSVTVPAANIANGTITPSGSGWNHSNSIEYFNSYGAPCLITVSFAYSASDSSGGTGYVRALAKVNARLVIYEGGGTPVVDFGVVAQDVDAKNVGSNGSYSASAEIYGYATVSHYLAGGLSGALEFQYAMTGISKNISKRKISILGVRR